MDQQASKECPGCGVIFTLQDLIASPEVEPLGMQFVDEEMEYNVFYFTHNRWDCGSTFVVPVSQFLPFITEPVPVSAAADQCNNHCMAIDDLAACDAHCHYAPFRRFLLGVRHHGRTDSPTPVPAGEPGSPGQ